MMLSAYTKMRNLDKQHSTCNQKSFRCELIDVHRFLTTKLGNIPRRARTTSMHVRQTRSSATSGFCLPFAFCAGLVWAYKVIASAKGPIRDSRQQITIVATSLFCYVLSFRFLGLFFVFSRSRHIDKCTGDPRQYCFRPKLYGTEAYTRNAKNTSMPM